MPDAVAAMSRGGIEWIQIRAKSGSSREVFCLVEQCLARITGAKTKIWIDDRADLSTLFPVAGVHVGQDDLPPAAVRQVVGRDSWIGCSTHDLGQAKTAEADAEVDVVALGPIFPTGSKDRPDPVVGLDLLRRVREHVSKPLVAIGGIDGSNLASVLQAGADAVAVLGAVCQGDVAENSQRLVRLVKEVR